MTVERRLAIFDKLVEKARKVLEEKGRGYALSNDANFNVKAISEFCKLSTGEVILVLLMKHLLRILKAIKEGERVNEENIIDIINYLVILYSVEMEKEENR